MNVLKEHFKRLEEQELIYIFGGRLGRMMVLHGLVSAGYPPSPAQMWPSPHTQEGCTGGSRYRRRRAVYRDRTGYQI